MPESAGAWVCACADAPSVIATARVILAVLNMSLLLGSFEIQVSGYVALNTVR